MKPVIADSSPSVSTIVAYLFAQRETILNRWRTACQADPTLSKGLSLSREEFNDMLPLVLDTLEARLLGNKPDIDPAQTAQAHGLHRWQKSFALLDTMRELALLTQILYGELRVFLGLFPHVQPDLLLDIHQQIAQVMQETMEGSVFKFDELQRLEAAQRTTTLQQALTKMAELSKERVDLLRTSTHDLQGGLGIINGAAYMLKLEGLSDEQREQYLAMLNRNLASVEGMLTALMDLSRLEAGEEVIQLQTIDVAPLLREITQSGQVLAAERNLTLRADGPASLPVETDPVKLQRIVQNLLLNALKYIPNGFVSVSWSLETDARWVISVQDSGQGLPETIAGVFGDQLRPTVDSTSVLSVDTSEPVGVVPDHVPTIPGSAELSNLAQPSTPGEGIGLQIVKRLCELMEASMEIESMAGRGTLFRIRFPVHYAG